jgi:hypothetical protein
MFSMSLDAWQVLELLRDIFWILLIFLLISLVVQCVCMLLMCLGRESQYCSVIRGKSTTHPGLPDAGSAFASARLKALR